MTDLMTDYPTRRGYYYRDGKWYPSKKTKKREKLQREISREIINNPEKYPYEKFVISKAEAENLGYEVWWSKCKNGHLTERILTDRGCPVCIQLSRGLRHKRIKDGIISLTKNEELELHSIYKAARKLTKDTGVEHHVDHIRPLAAGGAHHPQNLQILTAEENLSKGATFNGKRKSYSSKDKKEARIKFLEAKKRLVQKKNKDETPKPENIENPKHNDSDGRLSKWFSRLFSK